MTPPVALTIAGSDSGGGAGIQADLHTFAALGVFGTSAITALTAQNTTGVTGIHLVPPDFVEAQIAAVLDDLPPAAVKTGMLATADIVAVVARRAAAGDAGRDHDRVDHQVRQVMVAASGARLLDETGVAAYRDLLPLARVLTPNVPEAEALLGVSIRSADDQRDAARELQREGPEVVVVKGGHLAGGGATDVVCARGEIHELAGEWIDTANTHGTGCTFAAATAAGLARGADPLEAIRAAKELVTRAIRGGAAWRLGAGAGPVDHLHRHEG